MSRKLPLIFGFDEPQEEAVEPASIPKEYGDLQALLTLEEKLEYFNKNICSLALRGRRVDFWWHNEVLSIYDSEHSTEEDKVIFEPLRERELSRLLRELEERDTYGEKLAYLITQPGFHLNGLRVSENRENHIIDLNPNKQLTEEIVEFNLVSEKAFRESSFESPRHLHFQMEKAQIEEQLKNALKPARVVAKYLKQIEDYTGCLLSDVEDNIKTEGLNHEQHWKMLSSTDNNECNRKAKQVFLKLFEGDLNIEPDFSKKPLYHRDWDVLEHGRQVYLLYQWLSHWEEQTAKLKDLKEQIVAHREIFASYGFFMPDFEAAIQDIEDVAQCERLTLFFTKNTFLKAQIIHFADGNVEVRTVAKRLFHEELNAIFERLEYSPQPEKLLVEERERLKMYLDRETERVEKYRTRSPLLEGYHRTNDGRTVRLKDRYRATFLDTLSNEGVSDLIKGPGFLNPFLLQDTRIGDGVLYVFAEVNGSKEAYLEGFFGNAEKMLSAGKSISEIWAFYLSENNGPKDQSEKPVPEPMGNAFCKAMPIETARMHFGKLTKNKSMNGKPFLTEEALESFIQRAFSGNTALPKQEINLNPNRERAHVYNVFYQFYLTASKDWEPGIQCREKYIRLLTENFENWDYERAKNNFTKAPKKPL